MQSCNFDRLKTDKNKTHEPSHDKYFDTHADDYNFATRRKFQNRSFGELHLTELIKL